MQLPPNRKDYRQGFCAQCALRRRHAKEEGTLEAASVNALGHRFVYQIVQILQRMDCIPHPRSQGLLSRFAQDRRVALFPRSTIISPFREFVHCAKLSYASLARTISRNASAFPDFLSLSAERLPSGRAAYRPSRFPARLRTGPCKTSLRAAPSGTKCAIIYSRY